MFRRMKEDKRNKAKVDEEKSLILKKKPMNYLPVVRKTLPHLGKSPSCLLEESLNKKENLSDWIEDEYKIDRMIYNINSVECKDVNDAKIRYHGMNSIDRDGVVFEETSAYLKSIKNKLKLFESLVEI